MLINLIQTIVLRLGLPTSLLLSALLRPSFLSLIYVILALVAPLLPSIKGRIPLATKLYLFANFLLAFLTSIAQVSYQVYAASSWNTAKVVLCNESDYRYWMNQLGLIRIKADSGFHLVRVVFPEVLSLISSIVALVVCVGLKEQPQVTRTTSHVQPVRRLSDSSITSRKFESVAHGILLVLRRSSDVAVVFLILIAGIIQPSVLNAVYFLVFLLIMSWYSTYIPIKRINYNKIKRSIIFYAAVHFVIIYIYQIPVMQTVFTLDNQFAERLIGLTPLFTVNCTTWWSLELNTENSWTTFVNFVLVILMYYLVIVQYCWTSHGVLHDSALPNSGNSSVHEDNFASTQPGNDVLAVRKTRDVDDNDLRVLFANTLLSESNDDLPRERVEMHPVGSSGLYRQQVSCIFKGKDGRETISSQGLIVVITFLLYHIYVVALLAMMLWSLWYHSVFGLLLLLIACFLWVFKDVRTAAMKVSAGILIYGEFLLISQYVCSMDIADLLPTADYMNWIGFIKATGRADAFAVLLVKSVLCLPLFILYRHHRRELYYESLNERDRVRWLSYGTFRSPPFKFSQDRLGPAVPLDESRGAQAVSLFSETLTKYWIFVVHIVLLWISLQHPPVLYTIGYFLIFSFSILLFLTSLDFYRRTLYFFWTLTIVYTSVVLIALYCYQFPGIPKKWKELTGLSDDWTHDIGLIDYGSEKDKGTLFARLSPPLLFFIVTMLQLKFFHAPWSRMVGTPNMSATDASSSQLEPG